MDHKNPNMKWAKIFFLEEFAPEHERVIQRLKNLRDQIQKETKRQKLGSVVYSSAGLVSSGTILYSLLVAPLTAGLSAVFTAVGAGVGVGDTAHRIIKCGMIVRLLKKAETILQAHEIAFSNLTKYHLLKLKEDIDIFKNKVLYVQQIKCPEQEELENIFKHLKEIGMLLEDRPPLDKVLDILQEKGNFISKLLLFDGLVSRGVSISTKLLVAKQFINEYKSAKDCAEKVAKQGAKQVAEGGTGVGITDFAKENAENCSKQAAKEGVRKYATITKALNLACIGVSLGLDGYSLMNGIQDLSSFRKGELCEEAEKLNGVINGMEIELGFIAKLFENLNE